MEREKVTDLVARVREAAKLHDPIASAVVELVRLSVEDVKESLVSAEGSDIHRLQGAARHLRGLYKDLTTTPPNIVPPGAK
jgi:hypothetical protein